MSDDLQQPNTLELVRQLWAKLDRTERKEHLTWTLSRCANCGRAATWDGVEKPQGNWCDTCRAAEPELLTRSSGNGSISCIGAG